MRRRAERVPLKASRISSSAETGSARRTKSSVFLAGTLMRGSLISCFLTPEYQRLNFFFTDDLGEGEFQLDRAGGLVRITGEGLDDQLHRLVFNELLDLGRFILFADKDVLFRQHFHGADTEHGVHGVGFLALEIDQQLVVGFGVLLDLAETPAAVDDNKHRASSPPACVWTP